MFVYKHRKVQILRVNNSRILTIKNAKFPGYYFYMIYGIYRQIFQICISVPLNYCKYLNLFCNYTIWLFTAFAQINTSNVQQFICVDTLLGNGTSPSILDRKIKWIEAFQSRLMATSIGFSSLIGIIYLIVYSSQLLLTLFL